MIPKNGTIVIVDDKIDEALPLITALSKENISVKYYSGDIDSLPDEPISDIRILFMDLQLEGSSVNVDADVGRVMSILTALVSENNGPFILLIWSTKESAYDKALIEKIESDAKINPIGVRSMEKAFFFERVDDDSEQPYRVKPNFIENINFNIEKCLKDFDQMNLMMKFSNVVRSAEVSLLSGMPIDTENTQAWIDELSTLLFYMAEAEVGYQRLILDGEINNSLVNHAVLDVLSDLLNDRVKRSLSEITEEIGDWEIRDSILVSAEVDNVVYKLTREPKAEKPGEYNFIYRYGEDALPGYKNISKLLKELNKMDDGTKKEVGIGLVFDYVNRLGKINSSLLTMEHCDSGKLPGTVHIREDINLMKEILEPHEYPEEINDQMNLVVLELSPSCDYSQHKWKRNRIQPGVMIPYGLFLTHFTNVGAGYYYISPVLDYNDESVVIMLDKRFFTSEVLSDSSDDKPVFRLRKEMVIEVQNQLGAHVSRPGIREVKP